MGFLELFLLNPSLGEGARMRQRRIAVRKSIGQHHRSNLDGEKVSHHSALRETTQHLTYTRLLDAPVTLIGFQHVVSLDPYLCEYVYK